MNCVSLLGFVQFGPDIKYTATGKPYCVFTMAVQRFGGSKGQKRYDYIKVKAWAYMADACNEWMTTGDRIGVQGRIHTDSFQAADGTNIKDIYILAERIDFDTRHLRNKPAAAKGKEPPTQVSNNFDNSKADDWSW